MLIKPRKLVVLSSPDFAPFSYIEKDGHMAGIDIELAAAVAKRLNVRLEVKKLPFCEIADEIKRHKNRGYFISVSAHTITEGRAMEADFSKPYIKTALYALLCEDDPITFASDLSGRLIGVVEGYSSQLWAEGEALGGALCAKGTRLKAYANLIGAVLDLKGHRIDAVIADKHAALEAQERSGGAIRAVELKYPDGRTAIEEYGVMLPKGNKPLCEIIDLVIDEFNAEDKINA